MLNKIKVILPKREHLPVLEGDRLLSVYYHPLKSFFFLYRLKMILSLMDRNFKRLLDLGCGCGFFLPSLKEKSLSLYGSDIHNGLERVKTMLDLENIPADIFCLDILKSNSVYTSSFDGIVCMSVLEHIQPSNLALAVANIKNMLTDDGELFLGIPVNSFIARVGHRINGYDCKEGHPSSEVDIIDAVMGEFEIVARKNFPGFLKSFDLYIAVKAKKKERKA